MRTRRVGMNECHSWETSAMRGCVKQSPKTENLQNCCKIKPISDLSCQYINKAFFQSRISSQLMPVVSKEYACIDVLVILYYFAFEVFLFGEAWPIELLWSKGLFDMTCTFSLEASQFRARGFYPYYPPSIIHRCTHTQRRYGCWQAYMHLNKIPPNTACTSSDSNIFVTPLVFLEAPRSDHNLAGGSYLPCISDQKQRNQLGRSIHLIKCPLWSRWGKPRQPREAWQSMQSNKVLRFSLFFLPTLQAHTAAAAAASSFSFKLYE